MVVSVHDTVICHVFKVHVPFFVSRITILRSNGSFSDCVKEKKNEFIDKRKTDNKKSEHNGNSPFSAQPKTAFFF